MSKKSITRTTVEREETKQDSPIGSYIKAFLLEGAEFHEDLLQYNYKINVLKFNREGRAVPLTGRVYEDLYNLPTELGQRFGSSRYRLFIQITDSEGKKAAPPFCKIEDFPIEWDGPVLPAGDEFEPDEEQDDERSIAMENLRHQHAMEMKQLEINKEMMLAAMNAKSSGGLKPTDMMDLITMGMNLGQGKLPQDPSGDDDPLMKILNGPIGQALATIVEQQMSKKPPAPLAPAPTSSQEVPRIPS